MTSMESQAESATETRNAHWEPPPLSSLASEVCGDITDDALRGRLALSAGREQELATVEALLAYGRRVLLVERPGAGASALVLRLAGRIVAGSSRPELANRRVLRMNLARGWAVASTHPQPWARMQQIVKDLCRESQKRGHILFYDDFHLIHYHTHTGPALRDALEQLGVSMIASCPTDKIHALAQRHASLLALFVRLELEPLSPEETLSVLMQLTQQDQEESRPSRQLLSDLISLGRRFSPHLGDPGRSIGLLDEATLVRSMRDEVGPVSLLDVQTALSRMAGIPLESLTTPATRFLGLESFLNCRVLGQEEAVRKISRRLVVTKSRTAVRSRRPDGVFLFIGPSGVGKTETARDLAEYITGDEDNLVPLDMNTYADPAMIRTLIGHPGDTSNDEHMAETPLLARELAGRPHTVLLLDEFEKACSDIRLLFLNAIDTGIIHDNVGNVINLRHNTIIMTSNVGFSSRRNVIASPGMSPEDAEKNAEKSVRAAVEQLLPPEFLGRVDEIIYFKPLTEDVGRRIVRQKIEALAMELDKRIEISQSVLDRICRQGISAAWGARSLNKTIDSTVGHCLALLRAGDGWDDVREIHIDTSDAGEDLVATCH